MKKSNGIVIRDLESPRSLRETEIISRLAWQFSDLAISPVSDLIAGVTGGLTAGVFEEANAGLRPWHSPASIKEALPALAPPRGPPGPGKGLSIRLKLYQREWCLARGIRLVTWTYIISSTNARLNLWTPPGNG